MPHIVDWDIKHNGALAVLAGAPWTLLSAYDLFTDDLGNTWASSSSQAKRALNIVTGYSHSTIVRTRRYLLQHATIVKLSRDSVKNLYASRPVQPAKNVTVYHVTGTVSRCNNQECVCRSLLDSDNARIYYLRPDETELNNLSQNATSEKSQNETSSNMKHEDSNKDILPKINPESQGDEEKAKITPMKKSDQTACQTLIARHSLNVTNQELANKLGSRTNGLLTKLRELDDDISPVKLEAFYSWYEDTKDINVPAGKDTLSSAYAEYLCTLSLEHEDEAPMPDVRYLGQKTRQNT